MMLAIYVCDQHLALIKKLNGGLPVSEEHLVNPTYFIWTDKSRPYFLDRLTMLDAHTIEETPTLIYPIKSK